MQALMPGRRVAILSPNTGRPFRTGRTGAGFSSACGKPTTRREKAWIPSKPNYPAQVRSPHQLARAFLRTALGTWKLDGFGGVTELLVSELVANVVTHVGSPMTLRVHRTPSTMRVEIDDPSTEAPVVRHPDQTDEHGRGVLLVDQLANAWGVEPRDDGKTVWFELDVSSATAEVHHHPASH